MSTHSNDDALHLRLLSIFQFLYAGLSFLVAFIPVIHLTVGIGMLTGAIGPGAGAGNNGDAAFLRVFGAIFTGMASLIILASLTMAFCSAIAGWLLTQRRGYIFCLIVAGVQCMSVPFGTAIGIFTILVLVRPSVKVLFGREVGPSLAYSDPFQPPPKPPAY